MLADNVCLAKASLFTFGSTQKVCIDKQELFLQTEEIHVGSC